MERPDDDIAGCKRARAVMLTVIDGITEGQARGPSLLPGWTIGHVLTNLARNADSVVRRAEAAARSEVVDQYEGGAEGRAADIEAGAGRPIGELVADVRDSSARVETALDAYPADGWGRTIRNVRGPDLTMAHLPFARWREIETHLVDLGLDHPAISFSPELVSRWLPSLLGEVPERTDTAALMAWLIRRGPAPDLEPY